MRSFARGIGLAGTIATSAYWIAVAPTHSAGVLVAMFLFIVLGLIGSLLAARGSLWAGPLMALGAIPGSAAYLIPGLMLMAASLAATRPNDQTAAD